MSVSTSNHVIRVPANSGTTTSNYLIYTYGRAGLGKSYSAEGYWGDMGDFEINPYVKKKPKKAPKPKPDPVKTIRGGFGSSHYKHRKPFSKRKPAKKG